MAFHFQRWTGMTHGSQALDVQELHGKVQMAQEELEWVQTDLIRLLERAEQTAAEG